MSETIFVKTEVKEELEESILPAENMIEEQISIKEEKIDDRAIWKNHSSENGSKMFTENSVEKEETNDEDKVVQIKELQWTRPLVAQLIKLYRNHECLWRTSSAAFKNRTVRQSAISNIQNELSQFLPGIDRNQVKNKIQTIRNQHRRERNKVKQSKKLGSGPEDINTPSLWCYNLLHFLDEDEEKILSVSFDNNTEQVLQLEKARVQVSDSVDMDLDLDCTTDVSIDVARPFYKLADDLEYMQTTLTISEAQVTTESNDDEERGHPSPPTISAPSPSRIPTPTPSAAPSASSPRKAKSFRQKRKRSEDTVDELVHLIISQIKEEENDRNALWGRSLAGDLSALTEEQQNIAKKLCRDIIYYGSMQKLCISTKIVDFQ